MTKKSTMLKVVSILNIIFGAIASVVVVGSVATLSGAAALLGMSLSDALSLGALTTGMNPGLMMPSLIISIVSAILILVSGIMGLASKNVKLLTTVGLILIVITLISLILTCATSGFSVLNLLSFVLPILYFLGAKQSIQ